MSTIQASQFEAWRHNNVGDEPVDTEHLPFADSFFSTSFPAAIEGDGDANTPLIQTSVTHCRSYEVGIGKHNDSGFIATGYWADNYHNQYSVLTTKGNNFTRQEIFQSATAPSGYIPYGLMEGDALLRVLKASRLMREAGIDTEWIVRVLEPKELLFESERVDPVTFKKKLLQKIIAQASEEDETLASEDEAAKVASAIKDMSFFVTLRAMSTSIRPGDFLQDNERDAAMAKVQRIFTLLNDMFIAEDEDSDWETFDPDNQEHIDTYWTVTLPSLLGLSLGKLHNLGLAHHFPVSGNVNTLGGLVDLDSVHGQPLGLGDEPITIGDFSRDINLLLVDSEYDGMDVVIDHLEDIGLLTPNEDNLTNFQGHFLAEYLETRGFDVSKKTDAVQYLELFNVISSAVLNEDGIQQLTEAISTLTEGHKLEELIDLEAVSAEIETTVRRGIRLKVSVEMGAFCLKNCPNLVQEGKVPLLLQQHLQSFTDQMIAKQYLSTLEEIIEREIPHKIIERLGIDTTEASIITSAYRMLAVGTLISKDNMKDESLQQTYWNAIEEYTDSLPDSLLGSNI